MTINGGSDINLASFSGTIKYEPRFSTPQNYSFLKFTIVSERVVQGEVKGWEYTQIQLSGDDAVAWHQRGTLQQGVYIYATNLSKRTGKPYQDKDGGMRPDITFEYSKFNNSTLVIDTDHEENAGLPVRPIDAQSGRPAEPEEAPEGGLDMDAPAPAPRSLARPATRSAAPVRPATRSVAPAAAPTPVQMRMAEAKAPARPATRTPATAAQKATAASAVTAPTTANKYEDEEDIPF